jgi:sulfonate transport system substrate-binding protein
MTQVSLELQDSPSAQQGWDRTLRTLRNAFIASVVLAALALITAFLLLPVAHAQSKPTELRIGYQKAGSLFVLQKSQGTLEKKLAPLGVTVKWVEFPAGPQLLEGLNVGSIDIGYVGEAPPIFAQAAGAKFAYIGFDPASPEAEGIVVQKDSTIKTVADLKGKKIALNKGSNVHFFLVKLLEKHGLKYSDVQPVFLAPADARAAFEKTAVDAWVIWDPFLAAAEKQVGARILANAKGVVNNYAFYLGERSFVEKRPDVVKALFDDLVEQGRWLKGNVKQAATIISPLQGLDADIVEVNLRRYQYAVAPLTEQVIVEQQKIADTFSDLKLIPKPIVVRDAALLKPLGANVAEATR